MASTTSPASQYWHQALKLRKHLLKQVEKLQAESTSGVDISQFEIIEGLLEKFRLAFVHTIFLDFTWAVKESAEEALWILHTSINTEYRRIQGRLKHSSHVVERRKVEKSYNNFLRVAQKFYKGYIQRLTARYDVPELRRVAKGIEVQQMDDADQISPVLAELRATVLKSCHSTLLRMGDLSRYRTQARHKNSGYENALTYYSLAHQLKPKSGYAYHQMGIVHLDQGNHLDVVYHFYRSWAVESPHPNARVNLEAEFKSLQLPNSANSRHNASGTQDAFSMWFVRLHALFYKGEDFPQQAELEGEIMHRLEMACHNETSSGTLLKMALVNIAAHHVAAANYAESQTLAASRFYQFTLRFNALFMSTFCATFEPELKEAVSAEDNNSASVKGSKVTPIVEALLPLLRVYSMWLAARRQEISTAVEAFGGVVPSLIQNVAKVLTLLCIFSYNQDGLASCPYLLSEDLEIRGFGPLSEDIVPEACRCFCSEDGTPKTYLEDPSSRLELVQESLARVLDTLRCAYFLAEDATLPVSYRVVDNWLIFEYNAGVSSAAPVVHTTPQLTSSGGAADFNTSMMNGTTKHHSEPSERSNETPNDQTTDRIDLGPQYALDDDLLQDQASADDAENTVINMLTPFLKPPEPQLHQQQGRSPTDSTYGMHTRTANELLGSFQTHPSPTSSVPSGKFAQLPWAWFNTPKPDSAMENLTPSGQDAFSAQPSPYSSPRHPFATGKQLDDPFATPGRNHYGAFINGSVVQRNRRNLASPAFSGAEPANHRNNLLQAFSGTNVPRSSPFTQWAETQRSMGEGEAPLPRQPRVLDHAPPPPPLQSTGTSGFSHPSSLYQGTPANGVGLGVGVGVGVGVGTVAGQSTATGFANHQGESSGIYYRMDQTTSSYNDAIMQAAYHGNN